MVAIAAPPAPMFKWRIKIGSKIILIIEPVIVPIIDSVANPSVLMRLLGVKETIIKVAPKAI